MMILVLEVEFLSGISFAALGPDTDATEWPPQPDRIFSALVAAWGARGEDPSEATALEWLERQQIPLIAASDAGSRSAPIAFVPPNDPRSNKGSAREVMPALRRRQPRRFPAAHPHDPLVRLTWDVAAVEDSVLNCLQMLAKDVAYVGHSTSLTRCRFELNPDAGKRPGGLMPRRRIYGGRMRELRAAFTSGRRPLQGAPVSTLADDPRESMGVFADNWLLLEHLGDAMPDIRACALVARTLRDTILSGYDRTGLGGNVPEVVSGHTADGKPSHKPHIAIVPLPFAGFAHSDGHALGFAVVPPRGSGLLEDADFRRALRAVAPIDEHRGRRIVTVTSKGRVAKPNGFSIKFSPAFEPPVEKRSLDPDLYLGPARDFATLTPIVLDRHLKSKVGAREDELVALIAQACLNVGLPQPELVVADKHCLFRESCGCNHGLSVAPVG